VNIRHTYQSGLLEESCISTIPLRLFDKKIAAPHPRRVEACLDLLTVHHGLQVKRAGRAQPLREDPNVIHDRRLLKGAAQITNKRPMQGIRSAVGVQFIAPAMVSAAQSAMNCALTMEAHP
jgi:hypothetical protein